MEDSELYTSAQLTVEEVAKILRVSHITVRRMMAKGVAPPHYRVLRQVRFDHGALQEWIDNKGKA